jgi:hypothetical protein
MHVVAGLPFEDGFQDVRAFMDRAIVHDDNRVFGRERAHLVEQFLDENFECIGLIRPFT